MKKNGCDLLVLEGMGRAVHTNLFAEFKCECLKVAVLKNRWLANKLGGDMYAVIFRYRLPQIQGRKAVYKYTTGITVGLNFLSGTRNPENIARQKLYPGLQIQRKRSNSYPRPCVKYSLNL